MVKWVIIGVFVNALALYITDFLLNGISIDGFLTLIFSALILGAVNTFIKPIVQIISLPLTLLTFGIFALIVNAAMLGLASALVPGWSIAGFWSAFWGAVLLSLCSVLISHLIKTQTR